MLNRIAKLLMHLLASSITAFFAGILSVILTMMGGFLIIPAFQTWFIMKYQRGNVFISSMIAFAPWVAIHFYAIDQPNLTQVVINLACQSAIAGIILYGLRYHAYPKVMDYWSGR
ncbi:MULTISPECIES: hypothetical protein [Vibrio]|uniref:hypothetical protein n=1 Tax=Vibrio TaxID=662 RepID=UPI001F10B971|nr:hypothetical protein [Vibrio tasmaniensis]